MNPKHGLGRGLGALLSSSPAPAGDAVESRAQELPIDSIVPNPRQPRKAFDNTSLQNLSRSLERSGVLQPVVVRRHGQQYEIVVGERRWRAAKLAGLTHIPAVVREATDAETLELALVENLLREDLNPMEEAEAYQRLLTEFSWTQEELGQRVGKDRSSVANCLRLLKLPELIQADLRAGRLTMGHARALLSLATPGPSERPRRVSSASSVRRRAAPGAARLSLPPSRIRCGKPSPRGCGWSEVRAPGASRSRTPPPKTSSA
jgi:ParB family transcriptional regulator, chromosome partitioning protein